jgi:hypothetical protein
MFRRLGIFLSVIGIIMTMGLALVIGFDFISKVSFLRDFSSFLVEMNALGYLLGGLMGFLIFLIPCDSYFILWGSGLYLEPSIIVSLQLLLFFGIIGMFIGFRSSSESTSYPLLESVLLPYIFVFVFNIVLLFIILFTRQLYIGIILQAIIEGGSGKGIVIFFVTSVIENGTVIAVFSAFTNVILTPSKKKETIYCDDGTICDF